MWKASLVVTLWRMYDCQGLGGLSKYDMKIVTRVRIIFFCPLDQGGTPKKITGFAKFTKKSAKFAKIWKKLEKFSKLLNII